MEDTRYQVTQMQPTEEGEDMFVTWKPRKEALACSRYSALHHAALITGYVFHCLLPVFFTSSSRYGRLRLYELIEKLEADPETTIAYCETFLYKYFFFFTVAGATDSVIFKTEGKHNPLEAECSGYLGELRKFLTALK